MVEGSGDQTKLRVDDLGRWVEVLTWSLVTMFSCGVNLHFLRDLMESVSCNILTLTMQS